MLAVIFGLCLLPLGFAKRVPAVTRSEAAAVFAKAEQVMRNILQIKGASVSFAPGSGVATREQIVKHLATLYDVVQHKIKFTPPKIKAVPEVMSLKGADAKQIAQRLEVMGLVDRYGPLVAGKSPGLQPFEFGDALGYFMARVAELTHTPSSKFSPYLMRGE